MLGLKRVKVLKPHKQKHMRMTATNRVMGTSAHRSISHTLVAHAHALYDVCLLSIS